MSKMKKEIDSRRKFLRNLGLGAASIAGLGLTGMVIAKASSGNKVKVLTQDGKLVEVDAESIKAAKMSTIEMRENARTGIPNRKFVMVIDLAKCTNARKCVDACQEGHMLPKDHEWIKMYYLQDAPNTAPYWLPRPCFQCDNPLCVSVCPVGATYKRDDGIVIVDNKRCIGCKFCMTGCPYSARVFAWKEHKVDLPPDHVYDPEKNIPVAEGTVGKCVFCADKLRNNELPRCVTACPMGVIYFGDIDEDTVTNGAETVRFSQLMIDNHGYRYMEELGTHPSVYYLPPVKRLFPVERGFQGIDQEVKDRYNDAGPR